MRRSFRFAALAYAVMVISTIAEWPHRAHGHGGCAAAPGVLLVMTPANAPKLPRAARRAKSAAGGGCCRCCRMIHVHYNNQPIAVVVAETLDQAIYARFAGAGEVPAAAGRSSTSTPGFRLRTPVAHGHDPANGAGG